MQKKWHILDKHMQLHGQRPKFKDLKPYLWDLFRKQGASSIDCKLMLCYPCKQRKWLVRNSSMKQRQCLPWKNILLYQNAANNLHYVICNVGFSRNTWAVLRKFNVYKGSWKPFAHFPKQYCLPKLDTTWSPATIVVSEWCDQPKSEPNGNKSCFRWKIA